MKTTIYKNSILLSTMRTPQALGLLQCPTASFIMKSSSPLLQNLQLLENSQKVKVTF